jgi:hypothetical protein
MSRYREVLRREVPQPLACKVWGHTAVWGEERCQRCALPVSLWPPHGGGWWGWLAKHLVRH